MDDPYDAFCTHVDVHIEGAASGPLAGLTFAAKDLYDVAGHVTGGGNPDWLATHEAATRHAWAVGALLDAGATLVGKTQTDEISRGVFGENAHYGTPINANAPGRVPGGSSSGSAAAVAGGLADLALGTDTGGSVRVPASFCGLYGLRPSHGRVPIDGVIAQAPSYDTVGWFARDAETYARAGAVLLRTGGDIIAPARPRRLLIADDMFDAADPEVAAALRPIAERIGAVVGEVATGALCDGRLEDWRGTQAALQRVEAWDSFRDWIDRTNPRFGYDVAGLFHAGATVDAATLEAAHAAKPGIVAAIDAQLADGTVACLPTTPFVAPERGRRSSEKAPDLLRSLSFSCIAGIAGLPQISLPLGEVGGLPMGLSLMGARGTDETLIGFARALAETWESRN